MKAAPFEHHEPTTVDEAALRATLVSGASGLDGPIGYEYDRRRTEDGDRS